MKSHFLFVFLVFCVISEGVFSFDEVDSVSSSGSFSCAVTEALQCTGPDNKCDADLVLSPDSCSPPAVCCQFPLLCLNGTCRSDSIGQTCASDSECRAGFYSRSSIRCLNSTCHAAGSVNDTCDSSSDCADNQSCDSDRNVCVGLPQNSNCTPPIPSRLGYLGISCAHGLVCDPVNHVCVPEAKDGDACSLTHGPLCGIYSSCANGICVARYSRKQGEACTLGASLCQSGLACVNGVCSTAPAARIVKCQSDSDCGTGTTGRCSECSKHTGRKYCGVSAADEEAACAGAWAAAYSCYKSKGCTPRASNDQQACAQRVCAAETTAVMACAENCGLYKAEVGDACVASLMMRYCPRVPTWVRIVIAYTLLFIGITFVFIAYSISNCVSAKRKGYNKMSS